MTFTTEGRISHIGAAFETHFDEKQFSMFFLTPEVDKMGTWPPDTASD